MAAPSVGGGAETSAAVIGDVRLEQRCPGLVRDLLDTPLSRWRRTLRRWNEDPGDDPVRKALIDALRELDITPLLAALRGLPTNRSIHADRKVRGAAHALNRAIGDLWEVWLSHADFRSPLLILDEAHHAKNRATRLASLFDNEQGGEPGALFGRFERMLFLTATPFQLGHYELIEVLRRFGAVDWTTLPGSRERFHRELDALERALETAQRSTVRLDERWGRLRTADVPDREGWWRDGADGDSERAAQVRRAYRDADAAMRAAEAKLKPWVVRHRKPDRYFDGSHRRRYLRGAEILDPPRHGGIDIDPDALLPFLLAGRAQVAFQRAQASRRRPGRSSRTGSVARSRPTATPETALRSTRRPRAPMCATTRRSRGISTRSRAGSRATAARRRIRKSQRRCDASSSSGRRARRSWCSATSARPAPRCAGTSRTRSTPSCGAPSQRPSASPSTTCSSGWSASPTASTCAGRAGRRWRARRSASSRRSRRRARAPPPSSASASSTSSCVPTIARHAGPPRCPAGQRARWQPSRGPRRRARRRLPAIALRRVHPLLRRADRRGARGAAAALAHVQTGRYHAERSELEGEDLDDTDRESLLPTVRLANGAVQRAARRRLLLAFNSPLLPNVLIASSVLAEGVDLHLECRHVIHHDLDWNPSTLEQRTGRIDRIGSLAARARP